MTTQTQLHHLCDRCGAEINRAGRHGRVSHTIMDRTGLGQATSDLCSQCVGDFRAFLIAPVTRVHSQRIDSHLFGER